MDTLGTYIFGKAIQILGLFLIREGVWLVMDGYYVFPPEWYGSGDTPAVPTACICIVGPMAMIGGTRFQFGDDSAENMGCYLAIVLEIVIDIYLIWFHIFPFVMGIWLSLAY